MCSDLLKKGLGTSPENLVGNTTQDLAASATIEGRLNISPARDRISSGLDEQAGMIESDPVINARSVSHLGTCWLDNSMAAARSIPHEFLQPFCRPRQVRGIGVNFGTGSGNGCRSLVQPGDAGIDPLRLLGALPGHGIDGAFGVRVGQIMCPSLVILGLLQEGLVVETVNKKVNLY